MSDEELKRDPTEEMRKALFSMTVTFVRSLEAFMDIRDAKILVASYLEDLAKSLRQLQDEEKEEEK